MPVTGTPSPQDNNPCCDNNAGEPAPQLSPVSCNSQQILSATPTAVGGKSLLSRLRSISMAAGKAANLDWQLHDQNGNPISLSDCLCGSDSSSSASAGSCPHVIMYLRENLSGGCVTQFDAEVVDETTGRVRVAINKGDISRPGIYFAEMAVVDDTDPDNVGILFSNVFYLIANATARHTKGPPSIAEVRLHLRDSSGGDNQLIAGLKFDDAEIAMAISRPVSYWNEVPPDVVRFTTQNFPYRYHWLEAICAQLFYIAEEHYRANQLQYQAAGVAVDDMNKEANYAAAAQRRDQEWKSFVLRKKVELNIEGGYGGLGSPYGRRYGY